MYKELSEEELILLAIEHVLKGVCIPSGIESLLSADALKDIKDHT